MAVFPPPYHNNTDTTVNNLFNYGFGVLLTIILSLSLALNILAFTTLYKVYKPGLTKVLYLTLIISDLVYSLVKNPYAINNLLNPRVKAGQPLIEATAFQLAVAEVSWITVKVSINSIFGISTMRFMKMVFPWIYGQYRTIYYSLTLVPMGLIAAYSIATEVNLLWDPRYLWDPTTQDIQIDDFPLYWPPVFVPAGLSFVFSIATIVKLRADTLSDTSIQKRASVTIVLLSLGNLTWLGETLWTAYTDRMEPMARVCCDFTAYVVIPGTMAMYNPLVLCTRSSQVRRRITTWIEGEDQRPLLHAQ